MTLGPADLVDGVGERDHLTPFQVEVARIFFELKASSGYLVAGGAALPTHLTQDSTLRCSRR